MAASDDEYLASIKAEARRLAERELKRIQRLIRRELKELHDSDDDEEL